MKKKNNFVINGIILIVIVIFLSVIFTINGSWGVAQVIILIILAVMAGLQLWIYFAFIKDNKK